MSDESVGRNVRRARQVAGLSQATVATRMVDAGWPFHQQTLQKVETGKRPLRLSEAYDLAAVLGLAAVDVFVSGGSEYQSLREQEVVAMQVVDEAENAARLARLALVRVQDAMVQYTT